MRYSIVTNTLHAVESPTDAQVELIEELPRQGTRQWQEQQAYFERLRDRKYWIQCKCNGQALVHVKKGQNYFYLFSRVSEKRAKHVEGCQFEAVASGQTPRAGEITRITQDNYDVFPKATGGRKEPTNNETSTRNAIVRQSKLFKLVRHIMREAGLHRLHNGNVGDYYSQRTAFFQGAAGRLLNGVDVSTITFFNCSKRALHGVRDKLFNTKFKDGQAKTALLIWIADTYEVTEDSLTFSYSNDSEFTVPDCRTFLHHARGDKKDGPFLIAAFYKLGRNAEGRLFYSFPTAYVMPILSKKCWMLCDSRYEREMGNALQRVASMVYKQNQIGSLIEKPLEPLDGVGDGNVVPDFAVTVGQRRCFIEVMGYRTEEYIERKNRIVPLMETIAPVEEFSAYRIIDAANRQETMFKFAVKVIRGLHDG